MKTKSDSLSFLKVTPAVEAIQTKYKNDSIGHDELDVMVASMYHFIAVWGMIYPGQKHAKMTTVILNEIADQVNGK